MNDADATRRHLNDTERQKVIEAILNAPDNNASLIKQAWEKNIPDDCDINYRGLLVNLHPDKFRIPEEKAKAQEAFQKLEETVGELERSDIATHVGTAETTTNTKPCSRQTYPYSTSLLSSDMHRTSFAGPHFEGPAQHKVGDSTVELSRTDLIFLCCRRLWEFLSPKPDASDCTKKLFSNNTALREFIDTRRESPKRSAT